MNSKLKNFVCTELNWNINYISETTKLNGLNNLCYKVKYLNKFYFIRISYINKCNFNGEKNIINLCSKNKIAPKLFYFSKGNGHILSEWIDGRLILEDEFSSYSFIYKLVEKLKTLHTLKSSHKFNHFYEIHHNINSCKSLDIELPQYINLLLSRLNELESYCVKHLDYGLCHNDLNPSNFILSNDNLYIIDYEFSGMNDIFFDLATITWMMNESGRDILLKTYFKNPTEYHYKKLSYYLFIVKFWNSTWSLLKSHTSTSDYDYKKGAEIILEELYYTLKK